MPPTAGCSLAKSKTVKQDRGEQKRRLLSNFAFASAKEKGRKPMLLSPAGSDGLAEAKLDLDL